MMHSYQANDKNNRLVLAYTRKDVADLNTMIKAEIVKRGTVSKQDITISITLTKQDHEIQQKQGFTTGDRLLFRRNDTVLGVMNGSFGTLKKIKDEQFHVKLDNGNNIAFTPEQYNHLQLGYAATTQQDFFTMRDEFIKQAEKQKSQLCEQLQQYKGPTLER